MRYLSFTTFATASATAAVHTYCQYLDVRRNDEVICIAAGLIALIIFAMPFVAVADLRSMKYTKFSQTVKLMGIANLLLSCLIVFLTVGLTVLYKRTGFGFDVKSAMFGSIAILVIYRMFAGSEVSGSFLVCVIGAVAVSAMLLSASIWGWLIVAFAVSFIDLYDWLIDDRSTDYERYREVIVGFFSRSKQASESPVIQMTPVRVPVRTETVATRESANDYSWDEMSNNPSPQEPEHWDGSGYTSSRGH